MFTAFVDLLNYFQSLPDIWHIFGTGMLVFAQYLKDLFD